MRIDPLGSPRPHLPSREGKSIWGWRSKNRGTGVILVIPPPLGCWLQGPPWKLQTSSWAAGSEPRLLHEIKAGTV